MPWDTHIRYGMGQAKGAGVTGFHPYNGGSAFTGLLFRGDSRDPATVFRDGFQMHRAGVNVSGRVTSNVAQVETTMGTTRGVISCTKDVNMALYWAVHNSAVGYVYGIYLQNEPWAASATFNLQGTAGHGAAVVQQEIMLRSVPANRIFGMRVANRGTHATPNRFVGLVRTNVGYAGPAFNNGNIPGIDTDANFTTFTT